MKTSHRNAAIGLFVILLVLVGFLSYRWFSVQSQNSSEIDRHAILDDAKKSGLIMDEREVKAMAQASLTTPLQGRALTDSSPFADLKFESWKAGALADVTGGGSFGLARSHVDRQTYTLFAQMGGLPPLNEGTFYEGWLIKRGDELQVIDLGKALIVDDKLYSIYTAEEDLSTYNFFVLTLEQEDGNAAPGEHVLEGTLQ